MQVLIDCFQFREPDLCEASPASSEYSTSSTILLNATADGTGPTQQRGGILDEYVDTETAAPPIHTEQFVNDQNVAILFHAMTDQGYDFYLQEKAHRVFLLCYISRAAKVDRTDKN